MSPTTRSPTSSSTPRVPSPTLLRHRTSGARAESYDQIVDVPTPQIQDEIPEVFQSTPRERIVARIVDFPLPQIQRQNGESRHRSAFSERVVEQIVDLAEPLRVQALPTVVHRPAESVSLRFTECFHPLSSSWCGMEVDNDGFGQPRELGRHESRHIKPQLDRFVLHQWPSFLLDVVSFTKQVLAQIC